jgi:hypothetical protein
VDPEGSFGLTSHNERRDMPSDPNVADETAAALHFPRQPYPNVNLHPRRVQDAFTGNLGAIRGFSLSTERTRGGGAELTALFAKASGQMETKGGTAVEYDLDQPLAQALVLRAYLAAIELLRTDVRSAPGMSYVLARGPGGIAYPDRDDKWAASIAAWVPADVRDEVLTEHERRLGIRRTDDSHPEYWPSFARTSSGIVVAFLGGREMNHSNATSWIGTGVTCCIFGAKVKDWAHWTLVTPYHAWFEPPEA